MLKNSRHGIPKSKILHQVEYARRNLQCTWWPTKWWCVHLYLRLERFRVYKTTMCVYQICTISLGIFFVASNVFNMNIISLLHFRWTNSCQQHNPSTKELYNCTILTLSSTRVYGACSNTWLFKFLHIKKTLRGFKSMLRAGHVISHWCWSWNLREIMQFSKV